MGLGPARPNGRLTWGAPKGAPKKGGREGRNQDSSAGSSQLVCTLRARSLCRWSRSRLGPLTSTIGVVARINACNATCRIRGVPSCNSFGSLLVVGCSLEARGASPLGARHHVPCSIRVDRYLDSDDSRRSVMP